MKNELFWLWGFNIIVNSFLTFLTVGTLTLILVKVLRMGRTRLRAILLALPLLKIVIDLFLYDFASWALVANINPIESESGSRLLSAWLAFPHSTFPFFPLTTGVQLSLNSGQTFTPADLIALCLNPLWIRATTLFMASISIILGGIWLYRLYQSVRSVKEILCASTPCSRPIVNGPLSLELQKLKIELRASSVVQIPCAAGLVHRRILFPADLIAKVSQDEFEAIVAHEIGHVVWHDTMARLAARFVATLFWWIPVAWWCRHLEQAQEEACDRGISRFGLSRIALAAALLKVAKGAIVAPSQPLCGLVHTSSVARRIRIMTQKREEKEAKSLLWLRGCLAGVVTMTFLFGKFWIF